MLLNRISSVKIVYAAEQELTEGYIKKQNFQQTQTHKTHTFTHLQTDAPARVRADGKCADSSG